MQNQRKKNQKHEDSSDQEDIDREFFQDPTLQLISQTDSNLANAKPQLDNLQRNLNEQIVNQQAYYFNPHALANNLGPLPQVQDGRISDSFISSNSSMPQQLINVSLNPSIDLREKQQYQEFQNTMRKQIHADQFHHPEQHIKSNNQRQNSEDSSDSADQRIIKPSQDQNEDNHDDDEDEDQDLDDEQEEEEEQESGFKNKIDFFKQQIPVSHEVALEGHSRTITSIIVDKPSARLVTGSNDYMVKFWDFNGMKTSRTAFREVEPLSGHPIQNLSFSSDSQNILVVAGGPQICIIDREGKKGQESVKGDMYLTDMSKTNGHTSQVNDGMFHPTNPSLFTTSSDDSTIRLWDLNNRLFGIERQLSQTNLMKCADSKGAKTPVKSVTYTPDGNYVFGGCLDGSIIGFSSKSNFHRPSFEARGAHLPGKEISSLSFFSDSRTFISRSFDEKVKLWDMRNLKSAVCAEYNQKAISPIAKTLISPDEKYILLTTSETFNGVDFYSKMCVHSAKTLEQLAVVFDNEGLIGSALWSHVINQLVVGIDNEIRLWFDPAVSVKGALYCANPQQRQVRAEDLIQYKQPIQTPHALSSMRDRNTNKEQAYERMRNNPLVSQKPEMPIQASAQGAIKGTATVTQTLLSHINMAPDQRENPVQALLKLDKITKENPEMTFTAYAITQPQKIYDENPLEVKEQQILNSIQQFCGSCGLQLCTCKNRTQFI